MPPTSAPAAKRPSVRRPTRACSSMRSPPIVCVIPGDTRTADARTGRRRERQLGRVHPRRRQRHDVAHRAVAHRLIERAVVEHVPRACARLLRRRLHEVVLRPRHLALEELLAALVVDAGDPAVELRQRDELLLGEVRVRACCARRTRPAPLRAPRRARARSAGRRRCSRGSRAVERPGRLDVSRDELRVPLEAARRKDRRLGVPTRRGERHPRRERARPSIRAGRTACRSCADSPSRAAPPARRAIRATRSRRRAAPRRRAAALVAGRTFRPELVPLAETPDDAAREQHRPARAVFPSRTREASPRARVRAPRRTAPPCPRPR